MQDWALIVAVASKDGFSKLGDHTISYHETFESAQDALQEFKTFMRTIGGYNTMLSSVVPSECATECLSKFFRSNFTVDFTPIQFLTNDGESQYAIIVEDFTDRSLILNCQVVEVMLMQPMDLLKFVKDCPKDKTAMRIVNRVSNYAMAVKVNGQRFEWSEIKDIFEKGF